MKPDVRAAAPVVGLFALAVIALWPSLHSLIRFWSDIDDYEHGFLIALLSLGWTARVVWRGGVQGARGSLPGTLALAGVLLAWLITVRAGLNIAHQLLWPIALWCSVLAAAGWPVARRFLGPLGLLFFAIPVWDYGLPVLQVLSIFFSEQILALIGVPATISEYLVTIPEGTFAILEGCSGKRYFIVTLAVAYLAAFMYRIVGWRLPLFFLLSIALALLTNWVRIVIVIYAGHVTDMQHYLVVNEHATLGNILFAVLLVGVLLFARLLSGTGVSATPVNAPGVQGHKGPPPAWLRLAAIPLLLACVLILANIERRSLAPMSLGGAPLAAGAWQGPLPARSGWSPHYVKPDTETRLSYISAQQGSVELYANLYSDQAGGRELIHYENHLPAPAGWERRWSSREMPLGREGSSLSSFELKGGDGQDWVVAYLFRIGRFNHTSQVAAKLSYGVQSMFHSTPSGVIAIAARCADRNCDIARALVADFWENMQQPLLAMLPAGAGQSP